MSQKIYRIGISCIGSGVGQSVINSLRLSRLPFKTIGLGTNPFAFGAYDCDTFDYTLDIHHENYVDNLIERCLSHSIDLLIPGLDDELPVLAKNKSKLDARGIKVIIAGEKLISICRDKELMGYELNPFADVFVKTYNRSTIIEDLRTGKVSFPLIAKPRSGFASRGIEIIQQEADLAGLSDDHIIQELAAPSKKDPKFRIFMDNIAIKKNIQVAEISIQLVYSAGGMLLGRMMSYNTLQNGVPIEIVPLENQYIWNIIDKLCPAFIKMGIAGPLNIQGRMTDDGLKLYEMNPRFTGITGLRALMGFNEVEACVKEWLGIERGDNRLVINYNCFGTRQVADKTIPLERNIKIRELSGKVNESSIKNVKTVLVTGACGYLGQSLINRLITEGAFNIWAFDLDRQRTENVYGNKVEAIYDIADYLNGRLQLGNVDILVHLGFTRPHGTLQNIADSLKFTHEIFTRAATNFVPAILNISSQSVYGTDTKPPWSEITPVAPVSAYAQAKYATELLLETLSRINNVLKYSSIRLGTLAGGSEGLTEIDFLSKFVSSALKGEPIRLIGGMQLMQRFDIRDAADAIVTMLKKDPDRWRHVYNLSSGQVYNLKEIAEKVVKISSEYNGGKRSEIVIEKKNIEMESGMDSSLFYNDNNWYPGYSIDNSIESLAKYFLKVTSNSELCNEVI